MKRLRPVATARPCTLSIAIPGSIISNCQTRELQAYVAAQLARAAAIFRVNEVIIFSEQVDNQQSKAFDVDLYCIKQLTYLETPQYLRKLMFKLDNDLQHAGLQNPLDAPHHLRAEEESTFREGVVVPSQGQVESQKSCFVDCGLPSLVDVSTQLDIYSRVTVRILFAGGSERNTASSKKKKYRRPTVMGEVVSRSTPTEEEGTYWGYTTRLCKKGLSQVLSESPYTEDGGYDCVIGTSDKGKSLLDPDVGDLKLPSAKHILIVFGGLRGIESCILGDPALADISIAEELFDHYINTCPYQGSRTIRTEEAVLITLASLQSLINKQ